MTRRSIILDTTVRLVFDAAVVLSLYLLFAGHNQPGGGFVGFISVEELDGAHRLNVVMLLQHVVQGGLRVD